MASASVGASMHSCYTLTGIWLVRTMDPYLCPIIDKLK